MRLSGRLAAAASVLDEFTQRRVPLKSVLADWARNARYAGAKDRAFISGLCLDALRRRNSLAQAVGTDSGRGLALATLCFIWRYDLDILAAAAAEQPHGIGALTDAEQAALTGQPLPTGADHVLGDFPEWLTPHLERAFGAELVAEMAALTHRADLDLRVNTLRAVPAAVLPKLATVDARPAPLLRTAIRIPAVDADQRAPSVNVLPAYLNGEVEIQDLGSQIVAAAAGDIRNARVLDFCAGGGGKTLALAAQMHNSGELFAWDRDARRLRDVYERARRAGVDNLDVRNPAAGDSLEDLRAGMDVVFVDAPCSGSGVWRRHPDTKWRFSSKQLAQRNREQDKVLREAMNYVRPGGRLVYATCSLLVEENDDRIDALLAANPHCSRLPVIPEIEATGLLLDDAVVQLEKCLTPRGGLLVTPARISSDGLFVSVLRCA